MTAMRSQTWAATRRSWVMNRMARPSRSWSVADQLEDLRLHGDVEGGDRLVGDQHLGLEGERPRDADALALAAGELRVAVGRAPGRQADELEEARARSRGRLRVAALGDRPLGDDAPDRWAAG